MPTIAKFSCPYRLGCAAQRTLDLAEAGYTYESIARTLRAWWSDVPPLPTLTWTPDEVEILWRSARLYVETHHLKPIGNRWLADLGAHVQDYRLRVLTVHGLDHHGWLRRQRTVMPLSAG